MSAKSMVNVLQNTRILEEYRDRCYVNNILCQQACDYYGKIKILISIPLIILSSVMTILNSSELNSSVDDKGEMKKGIQILNIILNAFTIILLSLSTTLKISEKQSNFRTLSVKYNKLCHVLEDNLVYCSDKISHNTIFELVVEYDNLNESQEYSFPEHIKMRVKNMYKNKKTLPNILNCETDFIGSFKTKNIAEKYKVAHYEKDKCEEKQKNNTNMGSCDGDDLHNWKRSKKQLFVNIKEPASHFGRIKSSPYMNYAESPFVKHYNKRKFATESFTEEDFGNMFSRMSSADKDYKEEKHVSIKISENPPKNIIVAQTMLGKNNSDLLKKEKDNNVDISGNEINKSGSNDSC